MELFACQHRYYGKSIPFGSREEALKNASTRGYFNSAQAIADYAEVLLYIKKKFLAENSPVIVIGGSYGGSKFLSTLISLLFLYFMPLKSFLSSLFLHNSVLASWFRLKYPHVALGALASSAPILYFDDITPENGYYSIVTKDFRVMTSQILFLTLLSPPNTLD